MKDSPLKSLYPAGVKTELLAGCEVPTCYTTVEHEYDVLRNKVGIIDGVGYAMLKVSGDAASFLDGLVTKDICFLNSGKVCECLFLNEDAAVLGIAYILNNEDEFFVLVPPENAEAVTAWIAAQSQDGVTVEDVSGKLSMFFLEGELSWKIVKEMFSFPVETLPLRDMTTMDYAGEKLMMLRIGRSGEYGYCFIGSDEALVKLVRDCREQYADELCLDFCGTEALETCMLEISQPVLTEGAAADGNVFELNQQWFVQFEKEEYVGHDRLTELFAEPKERLSVGFRCAEVSELADGTPITLFGEEVGKVLRCKYNPAVGGVLGTALLKAEFAVSGIELTAEGHTIQTLSSPFVRPHSWDSQMD